MLTGEAVILVGPARKEVAYVQNQARPLFPTRVLLVRDVSCQRPRKDPRQEDLPTSQEDLPEVLRTRVARDQQDEAGMPEV